VTSADNRDCRCGHAVRHHFPKISPKAGVGCVFCGCSYVDTMQRFSEDMIRRDLPDDVMGLVHDLAYDIPSRDRNQYKRRAQEILKHP